MRMSRKVDDIYITEGEIAYSNFSGRPTQFKPEGGVRTVTFVIPHDIAMLEAKFTFRTRNGQPRDPKIFIVRNDRLVHMTEETIDTLDRADILSVDADLGASHWEYGGRTGITAYINSMYVTIKDNPVDEKYRKMLDQMNDSFLPTDDGDLPFPIE